MRQSCADTLATEEPDELIAHVRVCGGAGRVTVGSTRKRTGHTTGFFSRRMSTACGPPLTAGVRHPEKLAWAVRRQKGYRRPVLLKGRTYVGRADHYRN